jgi:periplasmic divalent cation tolerance protein
MKFIQVFTSVDTKSNARKIAKSLISKRLASCVQVLGRLESSYLWKGKVEHSTEWLCIAKARSIDYHRIESAIMKLHPYEVPEILAVPILYGNADYLEWIRRETIRD